MPRATRSTYPTSLGTPDWRPLEAVIPPEGLAPFNAPCTPRLTLGDFMWMGVVTQIDGGTLRGIRLYKHRDTRRYLNIDAEGRFYAFTVDTEDPELARYVEIDRDEALRWVIA